MFKNINFFIKVFIIKFNLMSLNSLVLANQQRCLQTINLFGEVYERVGQSMLSKLRTKILLKQLLMGCSNH